jgi:hypothetical protein
MTMTTTSYDDWEERSTLSSDQQTCIEKRVAKVFGIAIRQVEHIVDELVVGLNRYNVVFVIINTSFDPITNCWWDTHDERQHYQAQVSTAVGHTAAKTRRSRASPAKKRTSRRGAWMSVDVDAMVEVVMKWCVGWLRERGEDNNT